MNAGSQRIAKLEPRQNPDAQTLIQEVRDAVQTAQTLGVFDKIERAHMTRRCLWEGQSDDGMKHGLDAFPWDRAIDRKIPLADEIVSDHVRVRMASIRQGQVQIGPMDSIADAEKSKQWDDVLRYYRKHPQVRRALRNHFKLFSTCVEEIGYGVVQVDWRDEKVIVPVEVTLAKIVSFLAQELIQEQVSAAQALQAETGQEAAPPDEAALADLAAVMVEDMRLNPERDAEMAALLMRMDSTLEESEALRAAKELRGPEDDGDVDATYYAARSAGGLPIIKARIPWVDCGHATDLGPDGKCSWWFVAEWMDEATLLARAQQDKWAKGFTDEVKKHANKGLSELMQSVLTLPDWLLNGVGMGVKFDRQNNQRAPMFQILTVYRMAVNKAGIPACYETVIHPHVGDMLGKHECCEVRELPFIAEAREPAALMMQSRGVPEIVLTEQLALKKLGDATVAMAELQALPPYERAMGDNSRLAPWTEMPVKRSTGTSGTQSRFLDVPGVSAGVLRAQEMVRESIDQFFKRGPKADPDEKRLYLEEMGESATGSYEETMRILWLHIRAYVDNLRASRVAGRPVNLDVTADDLDGTADITVEFSALGLNQKTALELADYLTKLAPLDKSDAIDYGKAIQIITRLFDQMLSEAIIQPTEVANGEIERDEQAVISAIMAGQYVTGRVNSPNLRWQVLQQWLNNPQTVPTLQQQPLIYQSLLEHIKGLQQEMVQYQQNVFTGRTGQKASAPWQTENEPVTEVRGMIEGRMAA